MRLLLTLLLLSSLVPSLAEADEDARAHYRYGTTFYALGKYSEAAAEYEKAYQLHPDPALLYNAAQAHRMAGNKQRALLLYQNYLRLYGDKAANRAEVQRFVTQLTAAIESEKAATTIPPTTTEPPKSEPPVTIVEKKAPEKEEKKMKPWVWGVIGAAAVVVVGVSLGVGLGVGLSETKNPTPTLGSVTW